MSSHARVNSSANPMTTASAPLAAMSAPALTPSQVDAGTLRQQMGASLVGKDPNFVSLRELREQVAIGLGFQADALDSRKSEFRKIAQEVVQNLLSKTSPLALLLAEKETDGLQRIYLITMARVLGATLPDGRSYKDLNTISREDVALAVVDAFNAPLPTGLGGRPRQHPDESKVQLACAFKEPHEDGDVHFHIVVKLGGNMRFKNAKRTLQERHCLPSHFSCTHSLLWSALRYCYVATLAKPDTDEEPWVFTPEWSGTARDCPNIDLFALSQEPFRADSWRKRHEKTVLEASKKNAKTTFSKLDMAAVIESKHLYTKSALLAYVQDHGTKAMQSYACKNQRRLQSDIEDAKEWAGARENAEFEAVSDWAHVCKCAEKVCPHGAAQCTYNAAAENIFNANAGTVCRKQLAGGIRDVLVNGPTKTYPVPFLVGPSNSGKSTLMYPFDDLFHPKRVLHKPALGSTFGLRNLVGGAKRFIFWDDFRPVEYAQDKTIPASLFLTVFIGQWSEIQVSQSFNDGNKDIQWNHGAVFTGKQEGLWEPTKAVSSEEIRHMRNRVREFVFTVVLPAMHDVVSCPVCMAKWIVENAAAKDATLGLQPVLPVSVPNASKLDSVRVSAIAGLAKLLDVLVLPVGAALGVLEDLEELGAVSVNEPTRAEWETLSVWALLKPLQRRRLVQELRL